MSVAWSATKVDAIRIGVHPDKTRFVVELQQKPDHRIFYLQNPDRIVIDMQELDWQGVNTARRKVGLISNYRYGLFRKGTSRLVLDLKQPVKITKKVVLPPAAGKPYRFFIDITSTDRNTFAELVTESRKQQAKKLKPVVVATEAGNSRKKWTVVVDAGHGGIDPGAIGQSGVYEKQLTLAVAKKLRALLHKNPSYKVIMTRDNDTFLSLRERVSVARRAKGDLFISIHADSIGRPEFRGSTVYTLSEKASDREADELAQVNNKSDVIAGVDLEEQDDTVQGILIDLAQRETMNFSVRFAKILLPEISRSGMKVGSKSHRFAGFRVLKAPDVPSVLVELGYLSNRTDERIMKSNEGQTKLANSLAKAIDRYFADLES
ncbi:AMIN domain-containing protein [Sneathiella sp. P13V-1]|uniref:N-acetylmuramoyl-L-alanine amidase n=1 Tax=Sneathiella sp. P13V-1 TaxID=2697366 RepID=UPI00187B33DC|nr:N-acetylmuramoyl-L-alanine amidase [Sneathiella sp. P13V-1]MBE7637175.1 AMIN domain-containing protein [Sneathiella sp. P13V-1]